MQLIHGLVVVFLVIWGGVNGQIISPYQVRVVLLEIRFTIKKKKFFLM